MADYLHRIKADDPFWEFMHEKLEANERKMEERLRQDVAVKRQFIFPKRAHAKKGKDRRK